MILLLLRILQVSDQGSADNPKVEQQVSLTPVSHPASCYYQSQGFFFKIEACEQLALGEPIVVFGSLAPKSDRGLLSQKRLMDVRIESKCSKKVSVLCGLRPFLRFIFAAKKHFLKTVIGYFPTTTAQLSLSMLFGDKTTLSEAQSLLFDLTGTQHLIAASGYNVGLVAGIGQQVLRSWKRSTKGMVLVGAVWIYALWAGFGASIVRAAMMQSLAVTALVHHRLYSPFWGLLATCYVMVAINPWYLMDVGFQLSVAATASILLGLKNQTTSSWKQWITGEIYLRPQQSQSSAFPVLKTVSNYLLDSVKVGILAQVGTLPLVLYHFGEASLWSVLATSLVAWIIPFIMVGTTVVGLLAVAVEVSKLTIFSAGVQFLTIFIWFFTSLCLALLALFEYLPRWSLTLAKVPVSHLVSWWAGIYIWSRWQPDRRRR